MPNSNIILFTVSMLSISVGLSSLVIQNNHLELKREVNKIHISTEIIQKQNDELKKIIQNKY